MDTTLKKIEQMLKDAAANSIWGGIEIELKNGKPTVIRQTIQTKADEEIPNAANRK